MFLKKYFISVLILGLMFCSRSLICQNDSINCISGSDPIMNAIKKFDDDRVAKILLNYNLTEERKCLYIDEVNKLLSQDHSGSDLKRYWNYFKGFSQLSIVSFLGYAFKKSDPGTINKRASFVGNSIMAFLALNGISDVYYAYSDYDKKINRYKLLSIKEKLKKL